MNQTHIHTFFYFTVAPSGGSKEKWVSNYVPYGEYPAGKGGEGGSGGEAPAQQNISSTNGETKWKKNYVAYQEEQEGANDSNRIEEDK